jgi:hypothetical protein
VDSTSVNSISPYTFGNVVAEHTDWRLDGMWFVNGISLMGVWAP